MTVNTSMEKYGNSVQQVEEASSNGSAERLKYTEGGILLSPQPSDDPDDPLNWSTRKKNGLLAVMSLATWTGLSSATSTVIGTPIQARAFNQTPEVVAWTVSGTVAGLVVGPLVFIPLARVFGMCSISFWTTVLTTIFLAWAGTATTPEQFISYAVARGLTGFVACVAQVLTTGYIINVYYLHQRGRAFAVYSCIYSLGAVVGATFNGYVIQFTAWPNMFWWLVGVSGLAAVLIFVFMEETGFARDAMSVAYPRKSKSWIRGRIATFLPGTAVVPAVSMRDIARFAATTLAIGISPCTVFAGIFAMVNFAWLVVTSIQIPIYLQEPYIPEAGLMGYGFDALETANFQYSVWIGLILAQVWCGTMNDRWPMWLAKKRGSFKPEYRLYPAIVSGAVIGPVGLGLFGASIRYHFHWSVLAVATAMINFGAGVSVPVSINYVAESFRAFPQEVSAAMNVWRLILAFSIPFFYNTWSASVGVDWLWGMAAFLELFALLMAVVLMIWGAQLRDRSLVKQGL